MKTLGQFVMMYISWDILKDRHQTFGIPIRFEETDHEYTVMIIDGQCIYYTTIHKTGVPHGAPCTEEENDTALTDFETNFKNEPWAPCHVASDEGVQKVMLVPGKMERKMVVHGIKFDAPINQTTHQDDIYPETREIQGAWLEVENHQPGDYVELSVRGDIGYGEMELGKHGETIYIPPSGKIEQIVSEGTVSFPPGFKLRMTYVAVDAGETRTIWAWYRMRK